MPLSGVIRCTCVDPRHDYGSALILRIQTAHARGLPSEFLIHSSAPDAQQDWHYLDAGALAGECLLEGSVLLDGFFLLLCWCC